MFYNPFKVKKVPDEMLFADMETAQGFLDGVMAGDCGGCGILSTSKLESMGLAFMLSRLGAIPRVANHKGFATVYSSNSEHPKYRPLTLRKIPQPSCPVFDLATEAGEFVVGDVAIKNCDDFAWVFKGAASVNQFNCVGLVIGWWHGLHCWNVALTEQGVYQIEPQTGEIFTWKKGYVPLFVIL